MADYQFELTHQGHGLWIVVIMKQGIRDYYVAGSTHGFTRNGAIRRAKRKVASLERPSPTEIIEYPTQGEIIPRR